MSTSGRLCSRCAGKTLEKAESGPGSRGGRIIATSRAGRPIYASGQHTEGYHQIDHLDAAQAHHTEGFVAHLHGDAHSANAHRNTARRHMEAAGMGPKPAAAQHHGILHAIRSHLSGHPAMATAKSQDAMQGQWMAYLQGIPTDTKDCFMKSADVFRDYLKKARIQLGNAEVETIDGLDEKLTGPTGHLTNQSGPGGFTDQSAEVKKVKTNFSGNAKDPSGGASIETKTGVAAAGAIKEDKVDGGGPYECGGDYGNVTRPAPTKVVTGNILRSMEDGDLQKAGKTGEGSRGGKIIGHTKSGAPIYSTGKSAGKYSSADHMDAAKAHFAESANTHGDDSLHHATMAFHHSQAAHGEKMPHKDSVGKTASGKEIHGSLSAKYKKLQHADPNNSTYEQRVESHKGNAAHVKAAYPKYTQQDHIDAARLHEDGNAHGVAGAHYAAGGYYDGKKSLGDVEFRKSDEALVQKTNTGLDALCAKLAKGGSFYANGSDWHNAADPGVVQATLCKSCNHTHSAMYTTCPNCRHGAGLAKSAAQADISVFGGMTITEPDAQVIRFDQMSFDD